MSDSRNVFIIDSSGTDPDSRDDLKEFFTISTNIFAQKPDVTIVKNLYFNMDGLKQPTFVQGGGSSTAIGRNLKTQFSALYADDYVFNYHYIGVCAGGYVGVYDAEMYVLTEKNESFTYETIGNTKKLSANLDLISDFDAIGPFIPNSNQTMNYLYTPYLVNLTLNNGEVLPSLYVQGPAFIPNNNYSKQSDTLTMASFSDSQSFTLFPKKNKPENLAAIISQHPNGVHGGRFFTSTHILETSVPNSKFLAAFKETDKQCAALPEEEYATLQSQQQTTKAQVEQLIRKSLSKKT